jgi:glycosyltransferase involved in cell wall biosynthesis
MNILVLNWRDIEHPEAGGAEVHFFEIFGRLVGKGYGVTLLTTRFKNSAKRTTCRGINVLRYGSNYIFNWEAPFIVKRLLKTERYDCVIDDVNKLPFYTNRWLPEVKCGAFFHHLFGRTVFGLAFPPMALYVYVMEKLYGWMYRNVQCCAVSPSTAVELEKQGIGKRNLSIIENGIDVSRYCPDNSVVREDDLLVYVGRLKKYKRVDYILEAMRSIEKKGQKLRLAVIGSGDDLTRLRKRSNELGLADRVDFMGFVDEDKKIELLRKAVVFVNPSEKEGWGITNIEASACGTPVLANNAPGLRDSVIDNETGLLYRENDVASLAESLERLLGDKEVRERIGERGSLWAQKFSWDASARKVEEWLLKIVRGK